MKAHIIKGLKPANSAMGEHEEPFGTLQHVAHLPHPGVICKLMLGSAGLQYRRGEHTAVIPTAELVALFEAVNPAFAEKPNGDTRPAEVDILGAGVPVKTATVAPVAPQKLSVQN